MIERERLSKELRMMVLLAQNRSYTVAEMSELLEIPLRTVYRCLENFKEMGFTVQKTGRRYRLDPSSPFFRRITEMVHFTKNEALTLRNLLDRVGDKTTEIKALREKLSRIYDPEILEQHDINVCYAANLGRLFAAIQLKRVVRLKDYASSHSQQRSTRTVEPFQLLAGNEDVRCYEPASNMCKTFKVARIGEVVVLDDLNWSFEERHEVLQTDVFHFSAVESRRVELRLNEYAARLLIEEYGIAREEFTPDGNRLRIGLDVCDWRGVGRFCLGLPDCIEVLGPQEFIDWLRSQPHF